MTVDKYYTPEWLARLLVQRIPEIIGPAIDAARVEGALLDAVGEKFGASCPILAADIDEQNTKFLKEYESLLDGRDSRRSQCAIT